MGDTSPFLLLLSIQEQPLSVHMEQVRGVHNHSRCKWNAFLCSGYVQEQDKLQYIIIIVGTKRL